MSFLAGATLVGRDDSSARAPSDGDGASLAGIEGVGLAAADDAAASAYVHLEDDGATLIINGDGHEELGASTEVIEEALSALDTPDAVVERIYQTRALDGMQDATWGDFRATWNYHPDDGLDIIIEQADSP